MKNFPLVYPWAMIAVASMLLLTTLVNNWESRRRSTKTENTLFLREYASSEASGGKAVRKITQTESMALAEYQFMNFNNDLIQIKFSIPVKQLEEYWEGYGYSQTDLDSINEWQKKAMKDTYQYAVDHSLKQADLTRMGNSIKEEYHKKIQDLMTSRGLRYERKGVLVADIPGIVRRNVDNLSPAAKEISKSAETKQYDSLDIVGAALSFVQTGIAYEPIAIKKKDRIIGGLLPPVAAITEGRGDCDSKTALMASILLNWDKAKLLGVGMPNHYLIGVLSNPAKGDVYVEYNGLSYVLMEPAGPGWVPPGSVSEYTLGILNAKNEISLEPLQKK